MATIGQQRVQPITLGIAACLAALTAVLGVLLPATLPWGFLALAAVAILVYWAVKWEITVWAWIWVLSFGMFDRPFWVWETEGFFNMTIPRLLFLAAAVAFVAHMAYRGELPQLNRAVIWAMLAMLVCCAISAQATGWVAEESPLPTAPYFRFLGSLMLPFAMFLFVYASTRRQSQIAWALIPLTVYGWYALYIGYLQYAAIRGLEGARMFIWPSYISQPSWGPTYGIHFDRARGAYTMSNPQAILLITLFYADLFLIRRIRGPYRAALVIQAILIPPAIFFTGLRSGYLAFLLAGAVWLLWGARRRMGKPKLALAVVALILIVAGFWTNLTGQERATGGVAQAAPIVGRWVLAQRSLEMFKEHPLTGVGFGHYLGAEQRLWSDPAELTRLGTGLATPHNLLLVMAAETGFIGVLVTVAVLVLLFRESLMLYRRLPPTADGLLSRPFVVVFWAAGLAWLVDAMLVDPLWDVASSALFWSLAGLVVGLNRLTDLRRQDSLMTAADAAS